MRPWWLGYGDEPVRHSREGGNPSPAKEQGANLEMDSRLRGNDDYLVADLHPSPKSPILRQHRRDLETKRGVAV